MTVVTQGSALINYDWIRLIDYFFAKDFVGVRAEYADSETYVMLGQYKKLEAAQTAMDDLADAIEDGAALFRMPPC